MWVVKADENTDDVFNLRVTYLDEKCTVLAKEGVGLLEELRNV